MKIGRGLPLAFANAGLLLVILAIDWVTPPDRDATLLLALPILLTSLWDRPRFVWATFAIAAVGAVLGPLVVPWETVAPGAWVPGHVLAVLGLALSAFLALHVQRQRLAVAAERANAQEVADLHHVLLSTIAHELRAPLTMATEALSDVENAVRENRRVDFGALADARSRLRRSLRALEIVLTLQRGKLAGEEPTLELTPVDAAEQIESEIAGFAYDSARSEKDLLADVDTVRGVRVELNALILRQSLAVLIESALLQPGHSTIHIAAEAPGDGRDLVLHFQEVTPGVEPRADETRLGVLLARALAELAGGSLSVNAEGPKGRFVTLHLPVRAAAPNGAPAASV